MTYDQWKTTDPRDYDEYDDRDDDDDYGEPCVDYHFYHYGRLFWLTGRTTCSECGKVAKWTWKQRRLRWRQSHVPFRLRWRLVRCRLHYRRVMFKHDVKRPFRALRSWWRGDRKRPWTHDDEIPF